MSRTRALYPVAALFALACAAPVPSATPGSSPSPSAVAASPADAEIEPAQFTKFGGCGDAFFWAARADGTAAITVLWGGAATGAWANGAFSATEGLPHAGITVGVVEGRGLDSFYCNDVLGPGQGPTSTIQATSGTVEVSVRPDPQGFQPASHADLRLSNVFFHATLGSGETWHLDELVIQNVSVGWLAG